MIIYSEGSEIKLLVGYIYLKGTVYNACRSCYMGVF